MADGKRGIVALVLGLLFLALVGGFSPDLTNAQGAVACTMDAKICPDGTAVGRVGPNCEFSPCPGEGGGNAPSVGSQVNLPNPASVKCINDGGKLVMKDGENGQYGVCYFPDGSSCEEWAYYRGECARSSQTEPGSSKGGDTRPVPCIKADILRNEISRNKAYLEMTDEILEAKGLSRERIKSDLITMEKNLEEALRLCPANGTVQIQPIIAPVKPQDGCLEIRARIQKYKEMLLLADDVLAAKGLSRERVQAMLEEETKKYAPCAETGPVPVNATLSVPLPTITSCGEAKGLAENVAYYKKLLSLTDEELSAKGISREDVRRKFDAAEEAYTKAVSNCIFKPENPVQSTEENPCESLRLVEQKILYHKKLLSLTDSELSEKVQGMTRSDFEAELERLAREMERLKGLCKIGPLPSSANTCAPAQEKMKEYESLIEKLKISQENGDSEGVRRITEMIIALKREISAQASGCGASSQEMPKIDPTIQTPRPELVEEASEISGYYRQRLEEVVASEETTERQIEKLRLIRSEIDEMIEELLKKKESVNANELSGLASVEIGSDGVKVNGRQVQNTIASEISATVGNREAKIVRNLRDGGVSIEDGSEIRPILNGNIKIEEDGNLTIGGKRIGILPGEIGAIAKGVPTQVNLTEEAGKAVYIVKGEEKRRLFWIIPVVVETTERIDAGNGQALGEERPFWAFLAA